MTNVNVLERAWEQRQIRETGEVEEEISSLLGGSAGGPFFAAKEWPPRPPKKPPEGESFGSLPLWTLPLNDQRRGPAVPLALETSPGRSIDRKVTPTAYFVTPRGFGGGDVLEERRLPPRSQGQGQGLFEVVRGSVGTVGELPLLAAVRRAERALGFARGQGRRPVLSLPETVGEENRGLALEELDRAVERDARRYDGGFSMY